MKLTAPAKVNLSLRVLDRRADGYHLLETLMQPLDLSDELVFDDCAEGLEFACDDQALQDDNLVTRAARAFYQAWGRPARASIRLTKKIPVAAGLGGGSSDAAATLVGLNLMNRRPLPPSQLMELARGLGADVAFFLTRCTALCTGVGDRVEPWPEFPLPHYVLVNPGFAVSTAWVYGQYDLAWTKGSTGNKISRLSCRSLSWGEILINDLERVTLAAYPELARIKEALLSHGALGALMSGSGPTIFGVFAGEEAAAKAAQQLEGLGNWWVRACQGIGSYRAW